MCHHRDRPRRCANRRHDLATKASGRGENAVILGYDARARVSDRVRRRADGREHATWTEYDAADRPVRRGFPDVTYLLIRYDARGSVASMGGVVKDARWTA